MLAIVPGLRARREMAMMPVAPTGATHSLARCKTFLWPSKGVLLLQEQLGANKNCPLVCAPSWLCSCGDLSDECDATTLEAK